MNNMRDPERPFVLEVVPWVPPDWWSPPPEPETKPKPKPRDKTTKPKPTEKKKK